MERFNCPFCGKETEHKRIEEGGKTMWECQNCGVKHN
ncbi:MAG: transposase [Thermoplasmata archaeon]